MRQEPFRWKIPRIFQFLMSVAMKTELCYRFVFQLLRHLHMATPPVRQASSRSTRRVLVTVHVIHADIMLDTGKPSNIHRYNMTVHVNIYHEEDATIPYILEKVMESMDEENLVVVGPNGLILYDQEGTRGSIVSVTIYVKIYYRFDGKLPLKHKFNFSF